MVRWTERGIALYKVLASSGHWVVEIYPRIARNVLDIPRKGRGVDLLR
jgi:predicted nuclease with RNAse H fold